MRVLFQFIDVVLAIYIWLLLADAVLYCLIGFDRIDARRRAVAVFGACLSYVTGPVLRPMRRLLPALGGVDVSPIMAILLLAAVRYVIALYVLPKLP
jgi:YggT family protein